MSEPINNTSVPVDANEARSRPIRVRPGLLVNLVTHLEGGVEYEREDLSAERIGERQEGEAIEWKTKKRVADVEEHAAAARLRSRVVRLVKGACLWSPFGLICPTDQETLLVERIAEGHRLVAEFNATAVHTRVRFPEPLRGRIAEDTREAIAAVREEIHSLVGELQTALAAGSVETIRDVAQKATQMSRLLEDGTEARTALDRAVKESRRVATELVKRIGEGADAAAEVLATANVKLISSARMAFEEDEMGEITDAVPALPSAAVGRFDTLGEEYVEVPEFTVAEREAFLRLYERTPEEYFGDYRNEEGLEDRVRVDLAGFMRVDAAEATAQSSPGAAVGEALAARISEALVSFGEHSYDDRGPEDVMDVGACVDLVRDLPVPEIAVAFAVLMERHATRGEALIDCITEDLPEEVMEALDALAPESGEEAPAAATGVTVQLTSAAALARRFRSVAQPPSQEEETYDEDEIV